MGRCVASAVLALNASRHPDSKVAFVFETQHRGPLVPTVILAATHGGDNEHLAKKKKKQQKQSYLQPSGQLGEP